MFLAGLTGFFEEKSEIMKSFGITVASSANDFGAAIRQALN